MNISRTKLLIIILFYKTILELIYSFLIVENPIYIGFSMDFSIPKYIIGTIIVVITIYLLPLLRKPSSYYLFFYYLVSVIPLASLYALESNSSGYLVASIFSFYILLFIVKMNIKFKVKSFKINSKLFDSACYIIIFGLIVYLYTSGYRPSILAFNLNLNYAIRGDIEFSGILGYYFGIVNRAIIPGCFILSIFEKKYLKSLSFVLLQLVIFMFFPQKTILFSLLLVFIIYLIVTKGKYYFYLINFQVFYFIIASLLYIIFNFHYLITFSPRRTHFTPADIQFSYYDFFVNSNYLSFSQNLIGRIFNLTEVYDTSIVYIIGGIYYNSPNMSANTNFMADGYANFGILGMILVTVILSFTLITLDSFTKDSKHAVNISICFMPLYALLDASIFTAFLTHGILWVLIFIFLTHFRTTKNNKIVNEIER
ncbi:O-antigen polymerase [Bacillus solitudinis]|uniref:O-antigen polymerase n=1 Tax=Bacillus solitudinis TaxID=2014074 RepID=UPI000C238AD0|nr:O-antigen polymerase [Bacillus solitudinis]